MSVFRYLVGDSSSNSYVRASIDQWVYDKSNSWRRCWREGPCLLRLEKCAFAHRFVLNYRWSEIWIKRSTGSAEAAMALHLPLTSIWIEGVLIADRQRQGAEQGLALGGPVVSLSSPCLPATFSGRFGRTAPEDACLAAGIAHVRYAASCVDEVLQSVLCRPARRWVVISAVCAWNPLRSCPISVATGRWPRPDTGVR